MARWSKAKKYINSLHGFRKIKKYTNEVLIYAWKSPVTNWSHEETQARSSRRSFCSASPILAGSCHSPLSIHIERAYLINPLFHYVGLRKPMSQHPYHSTYMPHNYHNFWPSSDKLKQIFQDRWIWKMYKNNSKKSELFVCWFRPDVPTMIPARSQFRVFQNLNPSSSHP